MEKSMLKKGCIVDTMMMSDKEWKQANHLAGLFQSIVKDCKVGTFLTTLVGLYRHFY